jgi:diguanylate cyclase (GGDEF)-like protein
MVKQIRRALGRTALVAIVLVLVVGAGAVALLGADRASATQQGIHRADRLQLATALTTLADGYFLELVGGQSNAADALSPVLAQPLSARSALDHELGTMPGQPLALVLGPTGAPALLSAGAAPLATALSGVVAQLDAAIAGHQPAITDVLQVSGHPSVAIAVPVGSDGAVLVVSYRLDRLPLAAYVQQLRIGPQAVSYIIDGRGHLVTSPAVAQIGAPAKASLITAVGSRDKPAVVQTRGKTPDVVAVTSVGIGNWHLVITQPAPVFYGALWHATTTFRWAMLALLVVVAAALLTLHGRRQAALHTIAEMAVHDSLTGLPNRLAFARGLGAAMSRHSRGEGEVALLFCDLDGFKAVNDRLGHDAGDALLVAVADRLRRIVPATTGASATLARLGGDEFTVLLQGRAARFDAGPLATAITDAISEPFVLGPYELTVGVSVGVAFAQPDHDLLLDADVAMYRAKAVRKAAHEADAPDRFNADARPNIRAL